MGVDSREKRDKSRREAAAQWLSKNAQRKTITTLPSGLQYEVLRAGAGALPTYHAKALVHIDRVSKEGVPLEGITKRAKSYAIKKDRLFQEALRQLPKGAKYRFYFAPALVEHYPKYAKLAPNDILAIEIEMLDLYYKEGTSVNSYPEEAKEMRRLARRKTMRILPNGTQYQVLKAGKGLQKPCPRDWVEIHYTAAIKGRAPLANSKQSGEPILYNLKYAAADLKTAICQMTVGTIYRLEMPSKAQIGDLPHHQARIEDTLVYTIELAALVTPQYKNQRSARQWLATNAQKKGVTVLPSGIQYEVLRASNSQLHPTLQDSVKIHYTTRLLSGEVHSSSRNLNRPHKVSVLDLPKHLQHSIAHMLRGAVYRFIVPQEQLVFDVPPPPQPPSMTQLSREASYRAILPKVYDPRFRTFVQPFYPFAEARHWSGHTLVYDIELLAVYPAYENTQATIQAGRDFLAKNALRPAITTLPSGVQYEVVEEEAAVYDLPILDTVVSITYTCMLQDGRVIAERSMPITVPIDKMIAGLREGIPQMRVGAPYLFYIPQELAHGLQPYAPQIPAGAVLMYKIRYNHRSFIHIKDKEKPDPYRPYVNRHFMDACLIKYGLQSDRIIKNNLDGTVLS